MAADTATIHASAVLIGPKAALIRGPAGSGKSQLVWDLLQSALLFTRLVADDRTHVEACAGRLLVRPAPALAGMLEVRGLGIRRLPYEPVAAVGLVVDLAAEDAARQPGQEAGKTVIGGVSLPRLAVASGMPALPLVLAYLRAPPPAIDLGPASRLTPGSRRPVEKINHNGLKVATAENGHFRAPLWPHLFAVQQSAYIARQALATGLRMGLNAPPFVRRSVAPARSSG